MGIVVIGIINIIIDYKLNDDDDELILTYININMICLFFTVFYQSFLCICMYLYLYVCNDNENDNDNYNDNDNRQRRKQYV